jgi:hypothetical protein
MNFSWIEEEERLINLKENSRRENIQTLELVSIYINQQAEIETVERETMDIPEIEKNSLSRDQWTEWRDQRIKYTPNSKFILKDMLFFHVPIEPENIPEIKSETKVFMTDYSPIVRSSNNNNEVALSSGSSNNEVALTKDRSNNEVALDNIPIPPAIFIFHSLTTLFFFFHEIPNTNESIPSKIKTIQKNTKKTVKIQVSLKHNPNSNQKLNKKIRITRKQHKDTEI